MESALMFSVFLTLMLIGFPVFISLLIPSIGYLWIHDITMRVVLARMTHTLFSFPLVAVPLFMWSSYMLTVSGVTERIYEVIRMMFSKVRGATAHVNVVGSLIFAGMSGAALADIGGLGPSEIKAGIDDGYKKEFAAALTATSACIGPVFPPSIPLILLAGWLDLPTVDLLLGGVIPGILMSGALCMYIVYRTVFTNESLPFPRLKKKANLKGFIRAVIIGIPGFLAPAILLGGFLGGIFSPSEAGAITVLYTLFLGFIVYRELTPSVFWRTSIRAALDTASVLLIVAAASVFGYCLTVEGLGDKMATFFTEITHNPIIFMIMLSVFMLIVGCFMDNVSAMLLFSPLLMPTVKALGVNPVHFSIVLVVSLMLGLVTPPFGLSLFLVCRMASIKFGDLLREVWVFYIPLIVTLALVIFFPILSTWIPSLVSK